MGQRHGNSQSIARLIARELRSGNKLKSTTKPEAALVERRARELWEDAEIRRLSSPWTEPTSFKGEDREHYMKKARAALTGMGDSNAHD